MIVVDASVMAEAVGDDERAGASARAALRSAGALAAPDLIDLETVSALRKRWLAGELDVPRFATALERLGQLPIERHPALPLVHRTFELRGNLTPYDAAYVALAEALGCELVTCDAKLAAAPGPRCPIRLLDPA